MKNIRYLIIVLAVVLLVWLLPLLVGLLAPVPGTNPLVLYSLADSSFIRFETGNHRTRYVDFRGREFTKAECDSLLPLFSYRQLLVEGGLPDTVAGVAVSPKLIQQNSFYFKTSPKQLSKPQIGLYTPLESASGLVNLTLPPDLFRLTDEGLEFIDCETNTVLPARSRSYTRELEKQGFVFPVRLIWGNASTRKNYDNGFLLTDQNDALYQLLRVKGAPFVRRIRTDATGWKQLFTLEPANRQLIGMAVDADNQLYVVRRGYHLRAWILMPTTRRPCRFPLSAICWCGPSRSTPSTIRVIMRWMRVRSSGLRRRSFLIRHPRDGRNGVGLCFRCVFLSSVGRMCMSIPA